MLCFETMSPSPLRSERVYEPLAFRLEDMSAAIQRIMRRFTMFLLLLAIVLFFCEISYLVWYGVVFLILTI